MKALSFMPKSSSVLVIKLTVCKLSASYFSEIEFLLIGPQIRVNKECDV